MQKSDIYLSRSHALFPRHDGKGVVRREGSGEHQSLLMACESAWREAPSRRSFALVHEGIRHRVSVITAYSEIVFCVRRFDEKVRSLSDLRIHAHYTNQLMTNGLSGLVLVCGETASGKTTTCAGLIVDRLNAYGGVAIAVEDPVEMPLEGMHGAGACYQIEADSHGGFAMAMRDVVRMSPTIIFLGEIRDSETAIEAINASMNGHLVIATVHADSPIGALLRVRSRAESGFSSSIDRILAEGVAMVFWQKLVSKPGLTVPEVEMLSFVGEYHGCRDVLRQGRHQQLSSFVEEQKLHVRMAATANRSV